MDLVPVANQCENEQHKRDQQQPGSLRRVNRVAVMLVIVLGRVIRHADIVAPWVEVLGVRSQVCVRSEAWPLACIRGAAL